jgi:hypothetical protein
MTMLQSNPGRFHEFFIELDWSCAIIDDHQVQLNESRGQSEDRINIRIVHIAESERQICDS